MNPTPPPIIHPPPRRTRRRQTSAPFSFFQIVAIGAAIGFVLALIVAALASLAIIQEADNAPPRIWLQTFARSHEQYVSNVISKCVLVIMPKAVLTGTAIGSVFGVVFATLRHLVMDDDE